MKEIINELKKYKKRYEGLNFDFIDDKFIHISNNKDRLYFSKLNNGGDSRDEILDMLKEIFKIDDNKDFDHDFYTVVTGEGQEINKISNLRSSSLCGLLNFYKINEDNPIIIDNTEYIKVSFEVKNPVIKSPSSVDMVLESKNKILFLESKFSEYYDKDFINYSEKYINYWEKVKDFSSSYEYVESTKEEGKVNLKNKEHSEYYTEGIKQMICHYIGIINYIKNEVDCDNRIKLNNREVELATILFYNDKWNYEEFDHYKKQYEELAEMLNSEETKENFVRKICNDETEIIELRKKINRFKIRNRILTYQEDLFNKNPNYYNNISKNIKKYYRYED